MDDRALNRALLARQHLLARVDMPAIQMVEHLVGLQAQTPQSPYTALFARLTSFDPNEISNAIERREAVRGTLMRGTLHLVSRSDWRLLRPIMQPVLDRVFGGQRAFVANVAGIDIAELRAEGRRLLTERPRPGTELGQALLSRWPGRDGRALGIAVQYLEPLVQVPPRGLWQQAGPATWAASEAWLGGPLEPEPSVDSVVLRYLAAFGPASAADVRAWSGLGGVAEILARLGERLVSIRADGGRELWDVPDAPRPDPDVPAPPRFLPDYDNVFLGHADRSRIVSDELRGLWSSGAGVGSYVLLVDGVGRAMWRLDRTKREAAIVIHAPESITATERPAVEEEAMRVLAFLARDSGRRAVRYEAYRTGR